MFERMFFRVDAPDESMQINDPMKTLKSEFNVENLRFLTLIEKS